MLTSNRSLFSLASIVVVVLTAIILRFCYWENNSANRYNATSWDAFGY